MFVASLGNIVTSKPVWSTETLLLALWWHLHATLILGRQRQEDWECKAILGKTVCSKFHEIVSQQQQTEGKLIWTHGLKGHGSSWQEGVVVGT